MIKELLEVKGIFDAIQSTTLTSVKVRLIQENKDNELFKYLLNFLLDPFKVTGISKKKIEKKLNVNLAEHNFENIIELCEFVLKNNTGSDATLIEINNYISKQDEHIQDFIKGIITKSIKLGADSKIINKAIPGLIPTFSVMLAESYDKNKKKITGEDDFILTTKLDGNRIITIKKDHIIKFYTRQGKVVEGLVDISNDFLELADGVYDGELLAIGNFTDSKEQFTETMKRGRIKGEKRGLKIVCYDYIENIEDFYNGEDKTPCIERKNKLKNILHNRNLDHVQYLEPLYIGKDISMIEKYSDVAAKNKDEGIMLSIAKSKYRCKRVKDLLKVKIFKTCDIKCIRVEKGEGKYSDMVGKLICDYKGYELGVGSGLTDELRKKFIDNPSDVVGKIIEISYFEELETDGRLSVRFPSFVRIREDKKEVSYN